MYERQRAEQHAREEFMRDHKRQSYEEYQEKMRREGREDPFNTPFENWYAEQKSDPFSGVSLFGRYLRIMLWGVLFIGTLRVLGVIRGRGQIRREQQEEYLRMAEQDRML